MILFKNIRYKNLLSTGNSFTEIALDRNHSTLIVGDNGAGKSSILDALSFALYSKPFRKVNKGLLVNSINGKGLLVELEFQIGKKEYLIRRGIKPNVFEVFQNGELINQHADSKDHQEHLEKNILKLNHKSFSQIVVLGSASFVPFMQLTAQNRREVIEDLLDIEIFSTMNTLLKEKIQTNKSSIIDTDHELKLNSEKIEMIKKHINTIKTNNEELIKQKEEKIVELKRQIDEANTNITTTTATIDEYQESISDSTKVDNRLAKLRTLNSQLDSKLHKLEKEIEFFQEHDDCPTCRQGIQHEHKQEIVNNDNQMLADVQKAKQKLEKELEEVSTRLSEITETNKKILELNRKVSNYNIEIQTLNTFIDGIKKEIASILEDKTIVEDNSEELKEVKAKLKEAIEQKEELVKDRQVLDVAALLLRDSGIKTRIIKQYVPIMNKLINKYLAAMDFFVNFELNESFEEKIKSRFRDEFTYDSFSEGEKMRIDLSLLFTWRAIAKLRNSASTNLLIMDEVFDSSLDGAGTEEFLKILETLTNDTNVFIISHKGDQLFDKFAHVIKFEKHKNFSRIVT